MTHYIRNANGDTIADCEATRDDVDCVVNVEAFARLLLAAGGQEREDLIAEFTRVQEIRRLYFEGWHDPEYGWVRPADATGEAYTPNAIAEKVFGDAARKFGLAYVTD